MGYKKRYDGEIAYVKTQISALQKNTISNRPHLAPSLYQEVHILQIIQIAYNPQVLAKITVKLHKLQFQLQFQSNIEETENALHIKILGMISINRNIDQNVKGRAINKK